MRLVLLTFCLLVAGCAAPGKPTAFSDQNVDLNNANAVCLKRGLRPGSYNYESCYQNRPEVQAYERNTRLSGAAIILKNRSVYSSYRGRSYPVE